MRRRFEDRGDAVRVECATRGVRVEQTDAQSARIGTQLLDVRTLGVGER